MRQRSRLDIGPYMIMSRTKPVAQLRFRVPVFQHGWCLHAYTELDKESRLHDGEGGEQTNPLMLRCNTFMTAPWGPLVGLSGAIETPATQQQRKGKGQQKGGANAVVDGTASQISAVRAERQQPPREGHLRHHGRHFVGDPEARAVEEFARAEAEWEAAADTGEGENLSPGHHRQIQRRAPRVCRRPKAEAQAC